MAYGVPQDQGPLEWVLSRRPGPNSNSLVVLHPDPMHRSSRQGGGSSSRWGTSSNRGWPGPTSSQPSSHSCRDWRLCLSHLRQPRMYLWSRLLHMIPQGDRAPSLPHRS